MIACSLCFSARQEDDPLIVYDEAKHPFCSTEHLALYRELHPHEQADPMAKARAAKAAKAEAKKET